MSDFKADGGGRAQGAGGVHPARWGSQRGGGRASGRLKPDVKVTFVGDRPPRFGGDVVTFEDMSVIVAAYLENDQQIMHVANEDRRDRVLGRRGELVDSPTQIRVLTRSTMASPGPISPNRR